MAKTDQISKSIEEDISDKRIKEILDDITELTTLPEPIKPLTDIVGHTSVQISKHDTGSQINSSKISIGSESEDIISVLEKDLLISDSDEESDNEPTSAQIPKSEPIKEPGTVKNSVQAIKTIKPSDTNTWASKFKNNRLSDIKKRVERGQYRRYLKRLEKEKKSA